MTEKSKIKISGLSINCYPLLIHYRFLINKYYASYKKNATLLIRILILYIYIILSNNYT